MHPQLEELLTFLAALFKLQFQTIRLNYPPGACDTYLSNALQNDPSEPGLEGPITDALYIVGHGDTICRCSTNCSLKFGRLHSSHQLHAGISRALSA